MGITGDYGMIYVKQKKDNPFIKLILEDKQNYRVHCGAQISLGLGSGRFRLVTNGQTGTFNTTQTIAMEYKGPQHNFINVLQGGETLARIPTSNGYREGNILYLPLEISIDIDNARGSIRPLTRMLGTKAIEFSIAVNIVVLNKSLLPSPVRNYLHMDEIMNEESTCPVEFDAAKLAQFITTTGYNLRPGETHKDFISTGCVGEYHRILKASINKRPERLREWVTTNAAILKAFYLKRYLCENPQFSRQEAGHLVDEWEEQDCQSSLVSNIISN